MIAILNRHLQAARRRSALDTLAVGAPLALAAAALGRRLGGDTIAVVALILSLAALGGMVWRRARRLDRTWLIAILNARAPALEDSSELLFRPTAELEGLAALQQARLQSRTAEVAALDLRPAWSRRVIGWTAGLGLTVMLIAAFWPPAGGGGFGDRAPGFAAGPGPARITGARLRVTPPAYTGQSAFEQSALDVRAPANSRIEWRVGVVPSPEAVSLTIPGEAPLILRRVGDRWVGGRLFERSALYRVEAATLPRQRLHRLEMIPDAAPVVRMLAPTAALTLAAPGQTRWAPTFEARDDYGVASQARLRVTVTKGEGENITTTERTLPLTGQGEARLKRFTASLDLSREGLEPGGDMIVQLIVSDNRTPAPQVVEGPSVILRWPTDLGLADGLDGMARQVLPVYFRSQRQIIMDAEALITRRSRITPEAFLERSNVLGADQAQLRLRYGQFMGEEAEGGGAGLSLPTHDDSALDLPTNDGPSSPAPRPDHDDHHAGDGHDHGPPSGGEPATFGEMGDVVAQFGHAHDTGDAATLFDPGTRSTLARALDAMWDSERALRQGKPREALPHANRALDLLKRAQQATRIYLARTPPKLPPVDLSRRLTGKRDGIVSGRLAVSAHDPADTPAVEAWRALGQTGRPAAPLNLDALARWVTSNRKRLPDPLGLTAQIDTVRHEPDCLDCRRKLRALLWTALERPPASVLRRAPADPRGRRYLESLK